MAASSIRLSLNTIINTYLRQVAVTRQIEFFPFEPMTLKLEKLVEGVEVELISQKIDNARVLFANFRNIIRKPAF